MAILIKNKMIIIILAKRYNKNKICIKSFLKNNNKNWILETRFKYLLRKTE
jgi:hypothetical protein